MDDPGSHNKRKRPSYLADFVNIDGEIDGETKSKKNKKKGISQAVPKDEPKTQCLLCSKTEGSNCSIQIGASENTFAQVLAKLFQKEKLPTKLSEKALSKELLCTECKALVKDVFELQQNLQEKKNNIVSMLKKSQNVCTGINGDSIENGDKTEKTKNKVKRTSVKEKKVEEPEEEIFIIELLKEKKGDQFLVKWEKYSTDWDSWEPSSSIPDHIVKYYEEDLTRLGKPLPSQMLIPVPTAEDVYEVEKILEKRGKGKKVEYLVKWKNYDGPDDNTWEPADSLDGATDIIIKFEENLKIVEKSLPSIAVLVTEEMYEVEKILEKRVKGKKFEYLVKWKNYDGPNDNTWEPADSLDGATDIIIKFEENLKIVEKSLPSISVPETEEVYIVEKILEKKGKGKKIEYLVKWTNYDGPNDNTWEPADSLDSATDSIIKFEENLKMVEKSLPSIAVPETEEVYEVEKILEKREKGKKIDYLVKWKNYDGPNDNTWEPRNSLDGATDIIIKFEENLKIVEKSLPSIPVPETEEVYEVEKIIEKRGKGKKIEYLVKWKNYDGPNDNTWEPADSLEGAGDNINKFEENLKIIGKSAPSIPIAKTEEVYEVEKILEKRWRGKKVEYLVKWKNHDGPNDSTWEPANSLISATDIISKFENESEKREKANSSPENTKVEAEESNIREEPKIEEPFETTPKSSRKKKPVKPLVSNNKRKTDESEDNIANHKKNKNKSSEHVSPKKQKLIEENEHNKKLNGGSEDKIVNGTSEKMQNSEEAEKVSTEERLNRRVNGVSSKLFVQNDKTKTGESEDKTVEHEEDNISERVTLNKDQTPEKKSKDKQKVSTPDISEKVKKNNSSSKKKKPIEEEVYNIEALLKKKGSKYLVKWEGYSADYDTWEPKSSIPDFIVQYYEMDMSRLGKPAPSESQQIENGEEKIKNEPIVEQILDERIKKGKFEYLVKWKGSHNRKDKTWEPVQNIGQYQHLIDAFEKNLMKSKTEKDITEKVENLEAIKRESQGKTENIEVDNNTSMKEAKSDNTLKSEKTNTQKKKKEVNKNMEDKNETDPVEEVYIIESLLKKNGSKILVKWENYSDEYNSWEPTSSIPANIVKFYEEDASRFGLPAPLESIPVDDEEDYEVEKILEKKKSKKGKVTYLVKWKNFDDPADYTWEPLDNLEAAQDLVDKFEKDLEVNSFFS